MSKPLSSVSSIGVGGAAEFFVLPHGVGAFIEAVSETKRLGLPVTVVGASSNIIYSDAGFHGAVICTRKLNKLAFSARNGSVRVSAECGVMLPMLSAITAKRGLSGFEWLCSIPGTVGGAVMSNAGAFGQEISDFIYGMFILTLDGKVIFRRVEKSMFSYRKCNALHTGETVLNVLFSLKSGDRAEIAERMRAYREKRRATQPTDARSVGSYFKRPEIPEGSPFYGRSAGELIDLCGLKGTCIGGASISQKHANFIINDGGASADDILKLAEIVKTKVLNVTGITLWEEPFFVGCR